MDNYPDSLAYLGLVPGPVYLTFDLMEDTSCLFLTQAFIQDHRVRMVSWTDPFNTDDAVQRRVAFGPLIVTTEFGAFVTVLPIAVHVIEPEEEMSKGIQAYLGRDWLKLTGNTRDWAGRVRHMDWKQSWFVRDCAWVSCTLHEDPGLFPIPSFWVFLRQLLLDGMHRHLTRSGVRFRHFGRVTLAQDVLVGRVPSSTATFHIIELPRPNVLRTAADIPPELFLTILRYAGHSSDLKGGSISRCHVRELESFVLVCFYWAQHCRRWIFDCEMVLKSLKRLKSLEECVAARNTRLEPVTAFMQRLDIVQDWSTRSWAHRLHRLILPRHQPPHLTLQGPVPPSFPRTAFRSPHWGVPKSLPMCFTPFTTVTLSDIHFPALSDVAKLMRHFGAATEVRVDDVTWEITDLRRLRPTIGGRRDGALGVVFIEGCTNDALLCVQTLCMLRPIYPLARLPDVELEIFVSVVSNLASMLMAHPELSASALRVDCRDPAVLKIDVTGKSTVYDVSGQSTQDVTFGLHIAFDALTDLLLPTQHITGLSLRLSHHSHIDSTPDCLYDPMISSNTAESICAVLGAQFPSFAALAGALPALRVFVVDFHDFDTLKRAVQAYPVLQGPVSDDPNLEYRLVCQRTRRHPFAEVARRERCDYWVGIDPESLEPTGESWVWHSDILPDLILNY